MYHKGHVAVPIYWPAIAHLWPNQQFHYTHLLCWWSFYLQKLQSRQQASKRTNQNRPRGSIKTNKILDGHNASQIKLRQNLIYSSWISSTTREDITKTNECPQWPYWNEQSSEISGRIFRPTTWFQTAHRGKVKKKKNNDQYNKNLCNTKVSHSTNMYYTQTNALHHPSWLWQCHPV